MDFVKWNLNKATLFCFLAVVSHYLNDAKAIADDVGDWDDAKYWLEQGIEVVILPLPAEVSIETLAQLIPSFPQVGLNASVNEYGQSTGSAIIALPLGENVIPFFSLNGSDDGTKQGQSVSLHAGTILPLPILDGQFQLTVERLAYPLSYTSIAVNFSMKY
jgi:hypothetical protein